MLLMIVLIGFAIWSAYRNKSKPVHRPVQPSSMKSRHRMEIEALVRRIAKHEVSEEKMEALCLESQHVLVTARAGSGKTELLAIKSALCVQQGIRPEEMIALCFNRSATIELGKRMASMGAPRVPTSTFHALAYAIIKPNPHQLVFGSRQVGIVRHLLGGQLVGDCGKDELIEDMLTFISSAKHRRLSPATVIERCGTSDPIAILASKLYTSYTQYLTEHHLLDFDDLLTQAISHLQHSSQLPVVMLNDKRCNLNALRFITVDEFQDLSHSFYDLIRVLMDRKTGVGVYAVGDDWQCVNSYAGSEMDYFRHFERYFPGAVRSNLLTNYRSGGTIVENANRWMAGCGAGGVAILSGGEVRRAQIMNSHRGGLYARQMVEEITKRENCQSLLILARRNECLGIELAAWQKQLSVMHPQVRVSTVHKAKGQEADTVIYIREPRQHGGRLAYLNGLLGMTQQEMDEEERRIEYIAMTRAKQKLIIVE